MITLQLTNFDALTMLRSGRLTDAARSDLHTAILSRMVSGQAFEEEKNEVELKVDVLPRNWVNKIDAIKVVRAAVSDSYPSRLLGLREAKAFVEGTLYDAKVVLPSVKADEVIKKLDELGGWKLVKTKYSGPLPDYTRKSPV